MGRNVPIYNVLGIFFVSDRNIQGIDILLPSGTQTFVETKINDRTFDRRKNYRHSSNGSPSHSLTHSFTD